MLDGIGRGLEVVASDSVGFASIGLQVGWIGLDCIVPRLHRASHFKTHSPKYLAGRVTQCAIALALPSCCLTAASSVLPCPPPPDHEDLLKYRRLIASGALLGLDAIRLGPDWIGLELVRLGWILLDCIVLDSI